MAREDFRGLLRTAASRKHASYFERAGQFGTPGTIDSGFFLPG